MSYEVSFHSSTNPIQDSLLPLQERSASQGKVPVVFYRIVGMNDISSEGQKEYYDNLYKFNHEYRQLPSPFQIFHQFKASTDEEVNLYINEIQKPSVSHLQTFEERLVMRLQQANIYLFSKDNSFKEQAKESLKVTLHMYLRNEPNINESKAENFILKLIVWMNRYGKIFFKETFQTHNPKVWFLGDIKAHEIYFLRFLAFMGCDVLYFQTDKKKEFVWRQLDSFFNKVDSDMYGFLAEHRIAYPHDVPMEAFEPAGRTVKQQTVAFQASNQLRDSIYGADTGLYQAFQTKGKEVIPITLQTTMDEFFLLWKEPAKVRTGFKTTGEQVLIPNLFTKINGVPEEIGEYWRNIAHLKNTPSTEFIQQFPIQPITYDRQTLYSSAYILTPDLKIDKKELEKSKVCRYLYVREETLDLIFTKLEELLSSPLWKKKPSKDFQLKILMTVLTMEERFVRLIESFDYTEEIPKLVVYTQDANQLSEEDVILLTFFHLIGADVVILTPSHYRNIEMWIEEGQVSMQIYRKSAFNLPFTEIEKDERSLIKKWAQRLFKIND